VLISVSRYLNSTTTSKVVSYYEVLTQIISSSFLIYYNHTFSLLLVYLQFHGILQSTKYAEENGSGLRLYVNYNC
jgi:hypothetical protein